MSHILTFLLKIFYQYKTFWPVQAVNLILPVNRLTGQKIQNPTLVDVL